MQPVGVSTVARDGRAAVPAAASVDRAATTTRARQSDRLSMNRFVLM